MTFPETPLSRALCRLADRHGERPSIISASAGTLSYAMLQRAVATRAAALWAQGMRPGATLALINSDPCGFILSLLAIAQLGGCVIPLDPALDAHIQAELMRLGAAQFLLSADTDKLTLLEDARSHFTAEQAAAYPLLLFPTSGSTGQPKLAVRTQAAMLAEGAAYTHSLRFEPKDALLATVPLHHAFGAGLCIFGSIVAGCSLIVLDEFAPRLALRAAAEAGATVLVGVPYIFDLIARTPLKRAISLERVRLCLAGAARLEQTTFDTFHAAFGLSIRSTFGSSESGAVACVLDDDFRPSRVGQALSGVTIETRSEDDQPAAVAGGRLFVHTPAMMLGYLTHDGLDRTALQGGWFHTGDLARIDAEGDLYIIGRTAHIVNVAGKKVNPSLVEAVLRGHPAIDDAAVIGVTDSAVTRLAAFVVARDQLLDARTLIAYCAEQLPPHAVPRFIRFCATLSRNSTGKLMYSALEQLWAADPAASIGEISL